jgi:hypothetical protein
MNRWAIFRRPLHGLNNQNMNCDPPMNRWAIFDRRFAD